MKSAKNLYARLSLIACVTLISGYALVYAGYTIINSANYAPWQQLSSSFMTKIVDNITDLNTRIGAIPTSIGYGQTWQNVAASRVSGTTYTNSTGKPIFVSVNVIMNGPSGSTLTIDGVLVGWTYLVSGGGYSQLYGIVPPGSTYSINSANIQYWSELR